MKARTIFCRATLMILVGLGCKLHGAVVNDPAALRDTIATAAAGEVITFDAALSGQVIDISGSQIDFSQNITIDGSGASGPVTLFAHRPDETFVFAVSTDAIVKIRNVNFRTDDSPIFDNFGVLNISNCVFTNATEFSGWGGVLNETNATLNVTDSLFSKNSYGIKDLGGSVTVRRSTFENGTIDSGAVTFGGSLQFYDSAFTGNNVALTLNAGSLVLSNCLVSSNRPQSEALGAIQITAGEATLLDSSIIANQSVGISSAGSLQIARCNISTNAGGIYNSGVVVLNDSQFTLNTANVGGAVRNSGQLFATNTLFQLNVGASAGGAIANESGSATLQNCRLMSNFGLEGGAIYNNAQLSAIASTFTQNRAYNPNSNYLDRGGALYSSNGIVSLTRCELTQNKALTAGAIYKQGGQMTISGCNISGNSAESYQNFVCEAGGLYNVNGDLTFEDSTLSSNRVGSYTISIFLPPPFPGQPPMTAYFIMEGDGGGLKAAGGKVAINRSTIAFNQGSGIFQTRGDSTAKMEIRNCTIVSNIVTGTDGYSGTLLGGLGGGVYSMGNLEIEHSTIVGNWARKSGSIGTLAGGIYNGQSIVLNNSIVANNIASQNADITGGGYTGSGNIISTEPLLAPLGNFGGPTQTMPPLANSPAHDTAGATTLTLDQRGLPRVVGANADIGAVEIDLAAPNAALRRLDIRQMAAGKIEVRFAAANSLGVFATPDPGAPFANWEFLGLATETPPQSGFFRFEDSRSAAHRFYVLRNP